MDEQNLPDIERYLQHPEIQEGIQQEILKCRSQVTVPIGKAVDLLGLSENQLRKWETKGLLQPQRSGNHRYYSLQDLEKLAIISVLLKSKFPLRAIPSNIDTIWKSIAIQHEQPDQIDQQSTPLEQKGRDIEHLPVNQRIEQARKDLFWRYYVTHVLRLSLLLITEKTTQYSNAGLILPLHTDPTTVRAMRNLADLPKLGESLVGWLSQSGSSHTLLTHNPSFEHESFYNIYHLQEMEEGKLKQPPRDNTLIITNRRADPLTLNSPVVNTIQRLLAPLYQNTQSSRHCFGQGMRDALDPSTDLNSNIYSDIILSGLANMIVRLGIINNQPRWHFCCILLPDDTTLPLQQRSLMVCAQSDNSPHEVGKTMVSPAAPTLSLSLRAYQSGQIIYRPEVYEEDTSIAFFESEKPGSVIAVPTGSENGVPTAVLYVVSNEPHAFTLDDQRILRLIGRAVEELIITYRTRRQVQAKLSDVITNPEVTDNFFEHETENAFFEGIENILRNIQKRPIEAKDQYDYYTQDSQYTTQLLPDSGLSIISIEIDEQAKLAGHYGDQFARNLVKVVRLNLKPELLRIFADSVKYNFYYLCSGRYYLVIPNFSLEEACKNAERIRRRLLDKYEVGVVAPMNNETKSKDPDSMQVVQLSVHIGVSFYSYKKLEELLHRYSTKTAIGKVRALINRDIERSLDKGRLDKGNVVYSWNPSDDPQERTYKRWSP